MGWKRRILCRVGLHKGNVVPADGGIAFECSRCDSLIGKHRLRADDGG